MVGNPEDRFSWDAAQLFCSNVGLAAAHLFCSDVGFAAHINSLCCHLLPLSVIYRSIWIIFTTLREKLSSGFPTRSYTNWAAHPQKIARDLQFWFKEVEGLYYLCNENKGADQHHWAADLRLYFCICKNQVFS